MKKSVLIISYVPNYNRQGYDFAECLRNSGYDARLFQMDGVTDREKGIIGIKCIKPHGVFHKLHMLRNLLAFFFKTVFAKKDIVVCVGKPMLILGGIYNIFFGSKLVWYSLEYSKLGYVNRYVYQKCVTGYIDVEENRRDAIFAEYGKKQNSIVCYNMPHLHGKPLGGGRLRKYLKDTCGLSGDEQLVVYAGSFQGYACLDNIVDASRGFPPNRKLVLMVYGLLDALKKSSPNCCVVPPVGGDEFYEWLADADCALLPYESADDFNVQNCSPQKIFDCYVVGVPYVASDRPIVRKVLTTYPSCGLLCDFNNVDSIREIIDSAVCLRDKVSGRMRKLHSDKMNYDSLTGKLVAFLKSVDGICREEENA